MSVILMLIDSLISTFYVIFQYFRNFQDFQENDFITGRKMVLFGETSTRFNFFGSIHLCAKFHAFSTICNIPLNFYTILLHYEPLHPLI